MRCDYAPKAGDLIWITLSPQIGQEQAGRRPALVVSPLRYNQQVGLALCCPVTSKPKGYPFEVPFPHGCGILGVVLADQVRSLDWIGRSAEPAGQVPDVTLSEVRARIRMLLGD